MKGNTNGHAANPHDFQGASLRMPKATRHKSFTSPGFWYKIDVQDGVDQLKGFLVDPWVHCITNPPRIIRVAQKRVIARRFAALKNIRQVHIDNAVVTVCRVSPGGQVSEGPSRVLLAHQVNCRIAFWRTRDFRMVQESWRLKLLE